MSLKYHVFVRNDDKINCINLKPHYTCYKLYKKAKVGKKIVLTFGGRPILPNDELLSDLGIGSESVINVDLNMCWINASEFGTIKERIPFSIDATPKKLLSTVKQTLNDYPGMKIVLKADNPILRQMIKDTDWKDDDLKIDGMMRIWFDAYGSFRGVWCAGVYGMRGQYGGVYLCAVDE